MEGYLNPQSEKQFDWNHQSQLYSSVSGFVPIAAGDDSRLPMFSSSYPKHLHHIASQQLKVFVSTA